MPSNIYSIFKLLNWTHSKTARNKNTHFSFTFLLEVTILFRALQLSHLFKKSICTLNGESFDFAEMHKQNAHPDLYIKSEIKKFRSYQH